MISFFTIARAFSGHTGVIQRNALRSWRLLHDQCQVILIGDDGGSAEIAAELGLTHVPDVARNEYGSMLVNDVFARAEASAVHDLICYVSADIILLPDFIAAARRVVALKRPFLMGGQRTNLDVTERLAFGGGWERRLLDDVAAHGRVDSHECVDYFLFTRGLLGEIPPFAIGRKRWDRWIQYRARSRGLYIDSTEAVTAVHQRHDYGGLGFFGHKQGPESRRNVELAGGHFCDLRQARLKLTPHGVRPALDWTRIRWRLSRVVSPLCRAIVRFEDYVRSKASWRAARPILKTAKTTRRFVRTGTRKRRERIAVIGLSRVATMVARHLEQGRKNMSEMHVDVVVQAAHTSAEKAIHKANVIVLAAETWSPGEPTPQAARLLAACDVVGAELATARGYRVVVVSSPVIPGWTTSLLQPRIEHISGKKAGVDFGLCYWSPCDDGTDRHRPDVGSLPIGESDPVAGRYLGRLATAVGSRALLIHTDVLAAEVAAAPVWSQNLVLNGNP